MDAFLREFKGKPLGMFLIHEVTPTPDKPGEYRIDLDLTEEARKFAVEKLQVTPAMAQNNDLMPFYVQWSAETQQIHLFCVMPLTELGSVEFEEATLLANFVNGMEDRIASVRIYKDAEWGVGASVRVSFMLPWLEEMESNDLMVAKLIFSNNFVRMVVESQSNMIQMSMILAQGTHRLQ